MGLQLELGFCDLPEPIYLYVRNGDAEGKNYCWYYHDPETKVNTPEYFPGICGYLSELRLTPKEYMGKSNIKLDIVFLAGKTYIIRSGVETNFAKSFLLSMSLVEDLSQPIIIGCSAGDQNTVFCRIYDGMTKARIQATWNSQADWASIINSLQSRLSSKDIPVAKAGAKLTGQDLRIREIRTLLNYPVDSIMEWLKFQDATRPSELNPEVVDSLVQSICLDWAKDKFNNPYHAQNSYKKYVLDAVRANTDELVAIRDWVDRVRANSF